MSITVVVRRLSPSTITSTLTKIVQDVKYVKSVLVASSAIAAKNVRIVKDAVSVISVASLNIVVIVHIATTVRSVVIVLHAKICITKNI